MSKEANFLIYCMERYRYLKKLSGADVARIFEKYDIYGLQFHPESILTPDGITIIENFINKIIREDN